MARRGYPGVASLAGASLLGALAVCAGSLPDRTPEGQPGESSPQPGTVPAVRLARLARGVNLPHWFVYAPTQSPERARSYITSADLTSLRAAGLTHVRLPVDPAYIWDEQAKAVRRENLAEVTRAINLALDEGLAVIFDPHAGPDWAAPDP